MDVLAVPALALAGEHGWILAGGLIVIERIGKAIKKPAKSTLLSFAATQEGIGKSFAIQEMLDQIGAFLGPVMLYVTLLFKTDGSMLSRYAFCFALLLLPAVATIAMLFYTKRRFESRKIQNLNRPNTFPSKSTENSCSIWAASACLRSVLSTIH
ncbi:MAG: hypothetical protein R2881_09860 [Eubacteriales bacterium]